MVKYQYRTFDLEAIGITLPDVQGEHPNRVPFSGVLTLVDTPSDRPPNGAQGHRVMISRAVAEAALPTLIGMPIDVASGLMDHSVKNIGLITQGSIQGNELVVSGYLYGKQFPNELAEIQRRKDEMGMSYEITDVAVEDPTAPIWNLSNLVFTGGAILLKNSAAYTRTSLRARRDGEGGDEMATATKRDILKDLNALVGKLNAEGDMTEEERKKLQDEHAARLHAEEEKREEDEKARRAKADEEAARKLDAQDPAHEDEDQDKEMLKRLLEDVEAPEEEEALMQAVRRMFRSRHGRTGGMGATRHHEDEEATKQMAARMGTIEAAMGLLTDAVAKLGGLLTDNAGNGKGLKTDKTAGDADGGVKAGGDGQGGDDGKLKVNRTTLHAGIQGVQYLSKYGIESTGKYTTLQVDKLLKDSNLTDPETRIRIKHEMAAAGMLS